MTSKGSKKDKLEETVRNINRDLIKIGFTGIELKNFWTQVYDESKDVMTRKSEMKKLITSEIEKHNNKQK